MLALQQAVFDIYDSEQDICPDGHTLAALREGKRTTKIFII
ncbi:MAG: hypothetical protein WBA39_00270 [Rivularia sp. (in: cyanobacteria)]